MIFDLIMAAAGASIAPYVIGTSFGGASNSTTVAVSIPAGVQSGDVLIAVCQSDGDVTWTGDTGWTELVDLGSAPSLRIARKTAGASEPSSYTFTTDSLKTSNVHLIAIRGGTFGAIGSVATAQNPLPAPSITITKNDSLLLACFARSAPSVTLTTPTGMSVVALDSNSFSPSSAVFSEIVQSGATGSRTSTLGSSIKVAGVLLSIIPA